MKGKLLTITIIIGVLILATIVVFFVWTEEFKSKIPYFGQLRNNTSLIIQSKNSRAKVTIDGEDFGETPLEIDTLKEGSHKVVMTRISEGENFYEPATFYVELNNNTEGVINIEIGPDGVIGGYVLSYSPAPYASQNGNFSVTSPVETRVLLEDEEAGKTPTGIIEAKPGEYTLKTETNGYDSLEVPIVVRAKYNLNIELYLMPVPINL